MNKHYLKGTHRSCSPKETLEKIKPYMSKMGITRVANITGLDHIGIPVVTVCRPNSRALSVAQGKGLNLDSAKASGVMEAMESYLAENIDLPLRYATYNEMCQKNQVINPELLPQLSISAFHGELPLLWVEGYYLAISAVTQCEDRRLEPTVEQSCWVPFDTVHTNYTLPLPTGSGSLMMSTNGLASGNCLEEALSHAICELVERDSTSLWQLSGGAELQSDRLLDLSTISDPDSLDVLEKYQKAGMLVGVWDTTSDLGISSFYCTIIDCEENTIRPLYPASGAGCHPCKEIALLRALTEAAQTRLTLMSGSRDDTGLDDYEGVQNKTLQVKVKEWIEQGKQTRNFSHAPSFKGKSFTADLEWLLIQLRRCDINSAVVVNLSKPEFDISVVRVIVPGLEGISDLPGYKPGARAKRILEKPLESKMRESA